MIPALTPPSGGAEGGVPAGSAVGDGETGQSGDGQSSTDVGAIAEEVWWRIVRRLELEQERRGGLRWP